MSILVHPTARHGAADLFPVGISSKITVRAGSLLPRADRANIVWVMRRGVAAAERTNRLGRRHIPSIYLPGDAAGLAAAMLGRTDSCVRAVTQVEVEVVRADELKRLFKEDPVVGSRFWQMTLKSAAIRDAWATSLAIRDARGKLAHLFCELGIRFQRAGMGAFNRIEHPFSQECVGDMLGLTSVHINRTLKVMTEEGLIAYSGRTIEIPNRPALERVGEFDAGYLV